MSSEPVEKQSGGRKRRVLFLIAGLSVLAVLISVGAVIWILSPERHILQVNGVELAWDAQSEDVRVVIHADGIDFTYPRNAEWITAKFGMLQESFLLPRGHTEHAIAFEIQCKDGARYDGHTPAKLRCPSGEQSVDLFLHTESNNAVSEPIAWIRFEILPATSRDTVPE